MSAVDVVGGGEGGAQTAREGDRDGHVRGVHAHARRHRDDDRRPGDLQHLALRHALSVDRQVGPVGTRVAHRTAVEDDGAAAEAERNGQGGQADGGGGGGGGGRGQKGVA